MNWFTKSLVLSVIAIPQFFGMVANAAAPEWNVAGTYVVNFNNLGTDFPHDMTLAQNAQGNVTGGGGSPVGANAYVWSITNGSVSGNVLTFRAQYTAPADAVTPLTVMYATATIAANGSFTGTGQIITRVVHEAVHGHLQAVLHLHSLVHLLQKTLVS